ncbi:hypothetical protein NHL51_07020 [Leucobacter sp. gxy201]|uniref:hypothetical protein n=1 Tax=Leucobacter sp. gxy201 TaxID=2957200 RepID=UPI003D9FCA27
MSRSRRGSDARDRAASGSTEARRVLKAWGAVLIVVLALGALFGVGSLARYLQAPPISESFGAEDAVVALRLEARGTSYLVLVNEAGTARSVQLAERGFIGTQIAWSDAGISTGDPTHEYLIGENGLVKLAVPGPTEGVHDRARLASGPGFAVFTGSADGQRALFVDAAGPGASLTGTDIGREIPELASCGDGIVMATANGIAPVTPRTSDFAGLGLFDDVVALACDADRVYGLGAIPDGPEPRERLRVWDRSGGAPLEFSVRYPGELIEKSPHSPFVHDGRLYWTAEWNLWSVALPDGTGHSSGTGEIPVLDAVVSGDLAGFLESDGASEYEIAAGTPEGMLAAVEGRVFGVATDEEFDGGGRGPSFTRLDGLEIFSVDAATGERRIEIEVDGIDFPRRDLHVTAIAVDPEWAAGR